MAEAFLKWGGEPKLMTGFCSLTTRAGRGVVRNCKRGGHNFHFFQRLFFNRTNLKLIKKQEKLSGGSEDMLPRKNFENLHAVMAISRFRHLW